MDGSDSDDEAFDTAPSTPAELSETECNSPALPPKYKVHATNVCPGDRHQISRRPSNESDATDGKPDGKDPNETVTVANPSDTYTETESEDCDAFPIHKDNAQEVICPDSDDVGDDHLNFCNPSSESTSEDAEEDKGDDKQPDASIGTNAIGIATISNSISHNYCGIPTKTQPLKSAAKSLPDNSEVHSDMIRACLNKNEDTTPNKQIEATGERPSTENIVQATGPGRESTNDGVVQQVRIVDTDTTGEEVRKKTSNKSKPTKEPKPNKHKSKRNKEKKQYPNNQESDYATSEYSNHTSSDNKSSSENEHSNGKNYKEGGRHAADLAKSFVSIPSLRDASEENPQGIFVLDCFAVCADNPQDKQNTSKNKQPESKALSSPSLHVFPERELPTATCEQPSEIMRVAEDILSPCHLVSERAAHCLEKRFITDNQPATGEMAKK
ncbi:hypothetical protein V1264_017403 [Littorina saxatilis]|uniref:Uncharacterized protein n=1 Tax=Littorina saxatilis TaxID=31220 RepID=A0AAN9BIJ2_9CAEN